MGPSMVLPPRDESSVFLCGVNECICNYVNLYVYINVVYFLFDLRNKLFTYLDVNMKSQEISTNIS